MRHLTLVTAVLAMTAQLGDVAMAQTGNDAAASRNRAIVEASFRAWQEGTGSPFELLNDDATWTIVGRSTASKTYENRETFLREVIRPFNARMREPLEPTIRRIYSDGNTVIVFFDARGVAVDGEPYVNTYAWFLEMDAGRVTKVWAFFDSIEFNELWERVGPAVPTGNGGATVS